MPVSDKFPDYLLAALPEEYPIGSIPLSLKMKESHRKELVFLQGKFLETAESYIQNHPQIAFIAAQKHFSLLVAFQTDTTTFREIADKEYFDRVQRDCNEIIQKVSDLLDEETKANCRNLVNIQVFSP